MADEPESIAEPAPGDASGAAPADASVQIPTDARRITVGFDRVARWLDGVVARHGPLRWTIGATRLSARADDGTRLWLEVPFPPLAVNSPTDQAEPAVDRTHADEAAPEANSVTPTALIDHLRRRRRIGLVLVRRGGFGVAVFDGTDLIASKVGSSYVQGTTKAGGWSQQRFARRRANQARSAFATAADEAARVLLPEAKRLDSVVCGGDRGAVDAVLADPRLGPLAAIRSGPWLSVPDPRRAVVDQAPKQFLAVTIRIHP